MNVAISDETGELGLAPRHQINNLLVEGKCPCRELGKMDLVIDVC